MLPVYRELTNLHEQVKGWMKCLSQSATIAVTLTPDALVWPTQAGS